MATLSYIPEEIVTEILVRLPVKTLIRFKVVCKSWKSLIGSPKFIKTHLEFARAHCPCVVRLNYNSISALSKEAVELENADVPFLYPPTILGSANGLLCLDTINGRVLWNPSTRCFRNLPKSQIERSISTSCLGFSCKLNDYKLVILKVSVRNNLRAEVYTFSKNSWKIIKAEDMIPCRRVAINPVIIKERIYWIAGDYGNVEGRLFILAFDMAKDKFEMIKPPLIVHARNMCWSIGLVRYGETLALFTKIFNNASEVLELWVMNNENSWSKALTSAPLPKYYIPHKYWEDNEVILSAYIAPPMLSDLISGELKNLPWPRWYGFDSIDFVESLVSVDAESEIIG